MPNWIIYYHMWVYSPTHRLPIKSRMAAKIREMFAISWQPERRSVKTMFLTATTALYFCMALLRKTSGIHHPCGAAPQQILLGTGLSLSRPVLFGVPVFENHVSLILTTYCLVFSGSLSKGWSHNTLWLYGNRFRSFKVSQSYFSRKPKTKDAVKMAIVLVFYESANTKKALHCLYTYLRLTRRKLCAFALS